MTATKALALGGTFAIALAFISPAALADNSSRNTQSKWKDRVCNNIERSEIRAWTRFDQDSKWRTQAVQYRIDLQDRFKCQPTGTIVDQLAERSEFSILVEAVTKAGLGDALVAADGVTVFAPTNEAFTEALQALGLTKQQLLDSPDLASILTYHVVPQFIDSKTALGADGANLPTLNGATIGVDVNKKGLFLESSNSPSKVVVTDLDGTNGIIHAIDTVLLP